MGQNLDRPVNYKFREAKASSEPDGGLPRYGCPGVRIEA